MLEGSRALTTSPADIAKANVLDRDIYPRSEKANCFFYQKMIEWEPEYRVVFIQQYKQQYSVVPYERGKLLEHENNRKMCSPVHPCTTCFVSLTPLYKIGEREPTEQQT